MIEPTAKQIDRAARAMCSAKDLDWNAINDDWRGEIRRQAIVALRAALNDDAPIDARPFKRTTAAPTPDPHQVDLEELLG